MMPPTQLPVSLDRHIRRISYVRKPIGQAVAARTGTARRSTVRPLDYWLLLPRGAIRDGAARFAALSPAQGRSGPGA